MKIVWQFEPVDLTKVQALFTEHSDNAFVKSRIFANLRNVKPPTTKDDFWDRMVGCLLTTQQRSGPGSPVTKFPLTIPSPLEYSRCTEQDDLAELTCGVLSDFGGLRRSTTIGGETAANMAFLRNGG